MTRRLPSSDFLDLIHPHTGNIIEAKPAERGFSSDVLVLIEGSLGRFFVKGIQNKPGGRRDSIIRERLINESVQSVSPRLLWHAEDEQWIALGFELVDGRPSTFTPGSPDLPVVVQLLNRIAATPLPAVAHDWHETRWDRFATTEEEAALFKGDSLVQGDINRGNLLIGESDSWVVDWAWPTRGSAFIDPALLALQLIAAGHSPKGAESWVSRCDAWWQSDRVGIDAFALANLRMYRKRAARFPDQEWLGSMVETAAAWVDYRGLSLSS